jgi:hypothetical protein
VDSVHLQSSYGGVLESDESNNVIGPVAPSGEVLDTAGVATLPGPVKALPPR